MIVPLEAIFLSTFVMISQNRADVKRELLANQEAVVQDEDEQNQQLDLAPDPRPDEGRPRIDGPNERRRARPAEQDLQCRPPTRGSEASFRPSRSVRSGADAGPEPRRTMTGSGNPTKGGHNVPGRRPDDDVNDELFGIPRSTARRSRSPRAAADHASRHGREPARKRGLGAAQRCSAISVDNQPQVRLLNDDRRADAELRGDVLQALMLDSFVPKTVDAKVEDGFVTLTGTVDWQYQRDEADFVASSVAGLLDVFNEIELKHPTPKAGDVQQSINSAFERNAALDANQLWVSTHNGTVTIKGNVRSWAEHDEALDAAWAAPGVTSVDDAMTVAY